MIALVYCLYLGYWDLGIKASRLLHIGGDEKKLDIVSHTVMLDTEEVARLEGIVRAAQEPLTVPTGKMPIMRKLKEFDPATDIVSAYVERTKLFFKANSISAERQVPILLNAIG